MARVLRRRNICYKTFDFVTEPSPFIVFRHSAYAYKLSFFVDNFVEKISIFSYINGMRPTKF
jgi:hypothetical protein